MDSTGEISIRNRMELDLLAAESSEITGPEIYFWLLEKGVPQEVAIRFRELADVTHEVGGKVFAIGKIILFKVMQFIKAHPHLAIGLAIGAAIGVLAAAIPFIGAVVAPVVVVVAIMLGVVAGNRLDTIENGGDLVRSTGNLGLAEDIILVAKGFFDLLIRAFNAIFPAVDA